MTITVDGFAPNESLTFNLDSTSRQQTRRWHWRLRRGAVYPEDATVGTHPINIVGTVSPAQSAAIDIVAQPTVSPAAPTVTVSAWGTTGVTAAFSGFTPGEIVQVGYATEGCGDDFGNPGDN